MKGHLARGAAILAVTATCLVGSTTVASADESNGRARSAEGAFTASVDFTSLRTSDVRGNKCEFIVNGSLTFVGTLEGEASGTTTAVIFAPCAEALSAPPGTYFDIFRFEGDFVGEVLGQPASGHLSYAGQTFPGGVINASVVLNGEGPRAVLRADAQVAVGGTYVGIAKPE